MPTRHTGGEVGEKEIKAVTNLWSRDGIFAKIVKYADGSEAIEIPFINYR